MSCLIPSIVHHLRRALFDLCRDRERHIQSGGLPGGTIAGEHTKLCVWIHCGAHVPSAEAPGRTMQRGPSVGPQPFLRPPRNFSRKTENCEKAMKEAHRSGAQTGWDLRGVATGGITCRHSVVRRTVDCFPLPGLPIQNRFKIIHEIRPTQSIMHVPLQVNRFSKLILLIVQYKYSKSSSRRFIVRIWFSAQDYAVRCLLFNTVVFLIWTWQYLSIGNDLSWLSTTYEKAFGRGRPWNILHHS